MSLLAPKIHPYRLPLRRPWVTATGRFDTRSGWLLELRDREGGRGFGECAPLPEAGTESPAEAAAALLRLVERIEGQEAAALWKETPAGLPPACRCALESALLDLLSRRAGLPAARWLNPHAPLQVTTALNLGTLDRHTAERVAGVPAGAVVKLKVGMAPVSEELERLHELRRRLPAGVRLRLDANGAWERGPAERFLAGCAQLPVESLEEPLRQADVAALGALQAAVPFPLAVDESLERLGERLWRFPPIRRLVIKPMVAGGPRAALELARRAGEAGMESLVTTAVESAVGVWTSLHTAAALDGDRPGPPHGLATSGWLARDLATPPPLQGDRMTIADRPGAAPAPLLPIEE